ncbi:serine/threonine protein phosphatase 8, putative [Plasmodium vivax]|uniref:Serine/threonine-protein phosphatase n=1 Tax=Plasmodium vivax TaxID=5855 RepID=A0A564ZTB3_PLAVI|nr:serine/threonine protein phosphatase 8, putative [Plasmodium vivax]
MRNAAETGRNRPYVTRKDSLCEALPNHPCVTMPEQRYPGSAYARGYHTSAGGALLKGGTPNGSQAAPTAQINSLAALKMGSMGSYQVDWARRSYDGSSQASLAGGSPSLLHQCEGGKRWSDDRRGVNWSGVNSSWVNSSWVNSSGVNSPVVNPPVVYHLGGEANTIGGRSVSEMAHHSQRVLKVKEAHAGCPPRGMEPIYAGDHYGEGTKQTNGQMKALPPVGMKHTKRAPLMNANCVGSSNRSIRREVLHSWWGEERVGSPSSEASNCYTLPSVPYDQVGGSPKGMMGVVLVPANGETRNGFRKWDQNGKEVDAGLVHKWSSGGLSGGGLSGGRLGSGGLSGGRLSSGGLSGGRLGSGGLSGGRLSSGRLSRTSEYSYKDLDDSANVGADVGGVSRGKCYPDDASVESLPRNGFPWGSNETFLRAEDSNRCAVVAVGGGCYESGEQWYGQAAGRRLSREGLQRGVMASWEEGSYKDGVAALASEEAVSEEAISEEAASGESVAREGDAGRPAQCTYNQSDFTQWVSHNRLVKNIISSHNEDGQVERHGLYSLLFDAYGHNREAFRGTGGGALVGRAVGKGEATCKEIAKETPKETPKETAKETPKETAKETGEETAKETANETDQRCSDSVVEKVIFLKYLFNQYAHTEYPNCISFKRFKAMFEDYRGVFASEKIILFIFNCLDRCRRYYVSESDFLIGMLACSPQMQNDIRKDAGKLRHQLIFRAYDLDRDGYLSRSEMFVFMYHLYELSKQFKHLELKGNKKKMKKLVAVERDKLMRKCHRVSYDQFYRLVLESKVQGTQNLLRSNCDVASVVKARFLDAYAGGRGLTTWVDAGGAANKAKNPSSVQLTGGNELECSSAQFSGESPTGDANSEEDPQVSGTSVRGGDDPKEDGTEGVVQEGPAGGTEGGKREQSEEKQEEQSEEKPEEKPEEQPQEQPQSDGDAAEEPPSGHSNEAPNGGGVNSAEEVTGDGEEEVGEGEEEVSDGEEDKVEESDVVAGGEANAQLGAPPGESSTDSIPHFGGGHQEESAPGEQRVHEGDHIHEESEQQHTSRAGPERSWSNCVEQMKEIVKAYRERHLTGKAKLFGLNQDVAFKIFTTFYRVSYRRKREKYSRQVDDVCTAACSYNDVILLCDEAAKVLKGEDSIEQVELPCKVFGDLHGNVLDLLDFFNMYGWPLHGGTNEWLSVEEVAMRGGRSVSVGKLKEAVPHTGGTSVSVEKRRETVPHTDGTSVSVGREKEAAPHTGSNDVKYVFLGNYLNRGKHSLEVICLLLSLKVLFPKHIYLLRGNHEERLLNYVNGFYADIEKKMKRNIKTAGLIKYQEEVIEAHAYELFNRVNDVLEFLPLSVLVGGNILCVHAGIGDSLQNVGDFAAIPKPIVIPQFVNRSSNDAYEHVQKVIIDALWSDPINYEDEQDVFLLERLAHGEDVIPSSRGKITLKFGQRRLSSFLRRNKLKMLIRGHECVQEGFRYSYGRRLLTLFSATNYCGRHGNDAANAFIVRRGSSIVIFNQIVKCPRSERFERLEPLEPLEPLHKVNWDGSLERPLPREQAAPYPPEPLHWGDFPHEVGQPQRGASLLSGHRIMSSVCSPSEVPPLGVENWRSGDPSSRGDHIGEASTDGMGSQMNITTSKAEHSVGVLTGLEEEEKAEELPHRRVNEEVTPFNPNEKELASDGGDDEQSNLILRDSHPIVKRKLRDTRSNEDVNWGAAVQLEKGEGVPSRFARGGALRNDGHDGDRSGDHSLNNSRNSMGDDHSGGDARDDPLEGGPLRKSIITNGSCSSEEALYGGYTRGSSGRNYPGEMLPSKLSPFKGEGLEIEEAQNRQESKSPLEGDPHLGGDPQWEGEYLYDDYQHYLGNPPHGDALKKPPCDEPPGGDEPPCAGETKTNSPGNTNAIIETFFQNGGRDHGGDEHIYRDHLEDSEVERRGHLNHRQCAKLTPLSKRTNGVNVRRGEEGEQWEQNESSANLVEELMSKPMDYMMMPPDLGVANRPKLRRDAHSNQHKKEHGSATLRSLRSENNTSESLSKLQMQCLPADPKPQTKISLQKILDKLEDDA